MNKGIAQVKRQRLVLDEDIHQNALYQMIRCALELKDTLNIYTMRLKVSKDKFDQETFNKDYLSDKEQRALEIICNQLKLLFCLIKKLEGSIILVDSTYKVLYSILQEILPVFEYMLSYFEQLKVRAKTGEFKNYLGIQSLITLAQNKTKEYYSKTDASIVQIAALVLYSYWK